MDRKSGRPSSGEEAANSGLDAATFTSPPPKLQRLVRLADLPKFVGLRRTQVLERIAAGRFPKPIDLNTGGKRHVPAWVEQDLIDWQVALIAKRDEGGVS